MKLLFSGATNFLVPQKDASKSLGGYMSNTPVPNNRINMLFTDISKNMELGSRDNYAIFIYNDSKETLKNLTIENIYQNFKGVDRNICKFRFAVCEPTEKGSVEIIGSPKDEPFYVDWFEPETKLEQAFIKFKSLPIEREKLTFLGKTFEFIGNSYEHLAKCFIEAFQDDYDYEAFQTKIDTITIKKKNRTFNLGESLEITGSESFMYETIDFKGIQGTTLICEELLAGASLGLWIQREFTFREKTKYDCLKIEDEEYLKYEDLEILFNFEKEIIIEPQPIPDETTGFE